MNNGNNNNTTLENEINSAFTQKPAKIELILGVASLRSIGGSKEAIFTGGEWRECGGHRKGATLIKKCPRVWFLNPGTIDMFGGVG